MNANEDKLGGFAAMLKQALGDLLDPAASSLAEMMAEDGVIEFPFAPPGGVRSLQGRAELAGYLGRLGEVLEITSVSDPIVHRTIDPHVVVLEFTAKGRGVKDGLTYDQTYISVITAEAGRIRRYRDYWNPIQALRATGQLQSLAAELNGAERR